MLCLAKKFLARDVQRRESDPCATPIRSAGKFFVTAGAAELLALSVTRVSLRMLIASVVGLLFIHDGSFALCRLACRVMEKISMFIPSAVLGAHDIAMENRFLGQNWQKDLENAALAYRAIHFNLSTALLNNLADNG